MILRQRAPKGAVGGRTYLSIQDRCVHHIQRLIYQPLIY